MFHKVQSRFLKYNSRNVFLFKAALSLLIKDLIFMDLSQNGKCGKCMFHYELVYTVYIGFLYILGTYELSC